MTSLDQIGKVERYSEERRFDFDEVAFSRIVVNDRRLARDIRFKLMEGAEFFSLARQYSADESTRLAGGFVGKMPRTRLPAAIAVEDYEEFPGSVFGPLEVDGQYHIVKIEEI
ncbi:peptidylprolyl isomerase [Cohnella suwonensis]|uniref:peptidylprolyl isomerase n=1 Tax=Cohnella suwonensis TaxID=696072 RepID=A0ABW0LZM5_9BACL